MSYASATHGDSIGIFFYAIITAQETEFSISWFQKTSLEQLLFE